MTPKQSFLRRLTLGQKPNFILGLITVALAGILIWFGVLGVIGIQHGRDSGYLAVVGLTAGTFTGVFAVAHLSFALLDRKNPRD